MNQMYIEGLRSKLQELESLAGPLNKKIEQIKSMIAEEVSQRMSHGEMLTFETPGINEGRSQQDNFVRFITTLLASRGPMGYKDLVDELAIMLEIPKSEIDGFGKTVSAVLSVAVKNPASMIEKTERGVYQYRVSNIQGRAIRK